VLCSIVQKLSCWQTNKQVIWHDASRLQWQEYALEISEILHIFPSSTQSMGDKESKKAYTGPTKFGCDRSIVVGCRSRNDRHSDRHPNRQTSWMTIRLTLCERDATNRFRLSRWPVEKQWTAWLIISTWQRLTQTTCDTHHGGRPRVDTHTHWGRPASRRDIMSL